MKIGRLRAPDLFCKGHLHQRVLDLASFFRRIQQ